MRSVSSSRMRQDGALHLVCRRDELFAGINRLRLQRLQIVSPVSGSKRVMRSISVAEEFDAQARPRDRRGRARPCRRARETCRAELDVVAVYCRSTRPAEQLFARQLLPARSGMTMRLRNPPCCRCRKCTRRSPPRRHRAARRANSWWRAACRSISSLMLESFSMNVSVRGM